MITIDGKELRNLEEQVLWNKNRIEDILIGPEVLSSFGIKVVGQVTGVSGLPNAVTYEGEFGDAYLVGAVAPYDYYIFTRPFQGETDPKWFNLGEFPLPGPQGPRGPIGLTGSDGTRGNTITSATTDPTTISGYMEGDVWVNTTSGDWFRLVGTSVGWRRVGNIMGPNGIQGPQGIQGPKGDPGATGAMGPAGPAGPIVDIQGQVPSVDALPDPAELVAQGGRAAGYLVPSTDTQLPYYVYIIAGNETSGYRWFNAGYFSSGTNVTVGGRYVTGWNADTKLNAPSEVTETIRIPTIQPNASQPTYTRAVYGAGTPNTVVMRGTRGEIAAAYPVSPTDTTVVNKAAMDAAIASAGGLKISYSQTDMGGDTTLSEPGIYIVRADGGVYGSWTDVDTGVTKAGETNGGTFYLTVQDGVRYLYADTGDASFKGFFSLGTGTVNLSENSGTSVLKIMRIA